MRYLFSFYADAARIALQSILAHKLRAFLTLIGIIIGVVLLGFIGLALATSWREQRGGFFYDDFP